MSQSNQNHTIGITEKLLAINSTSEKTNNLTKVIDLAESYLKGPGIVLKRFLIENKPSLIATTSNTKTPTIFLNGHLDVVPAKPSQFKAKTKGDKLYARGAQDMKAACVVLMKVFKDLAQDKTFPREKLGLMLVTDEEIGGFHGSNSLLKKNYKSKFLLTGESTNLDIEIAAKGVLWLKLTSKGKAAHGAYLWEGTNAISPISQSIQQIQKLFPVPKKEVWKTTCNISSITGGNATNRVPDSCELKIDIRYIPKDNPDAIIQKVKDIIPRNIKVEIIEKEPFVNTDPNHPYLKKLEKITKNISGKKPKFVRIHGASDARFFSEKGIPTTSFGPIGKGLHSDNEWVSLKSLSQYEKILISFLKDI